MLEDDIKIITAIIATCGYPKVIGSWERIVKALEDRPIINIQQNPIKPLDCVGIPLDSEKGKISSSSQNYETLDDIYSELR